MKRISGIYVISCVKNKKQYVGQSNDIKRRWRTHKIELAEGTHYNKHLQRAYNRYGEDSFIYGILEFCDEEKLNEREQFWIDMLDTHKNGFNQDIGGCNVSGENNPMYGKSGKNSPRYIENIYQISKTGDIIAEFESANIAAKSIGGQAGHILQCTKTWKDHRPSKKDSKNPERMTHGGYQWIYVSDYNVLLNNGYDFSKKRTKNSLTIQDLVDKGTLDSDI